VEGLVAGGSRDVCRMDVTVGVVDPLPVLVLVSEVLSGDLEAVVKVSAMAISMAGASEELAADVLLD
jgi:hypothetical protein